MDFKIIFEDNQIVVALKPPKVPSQKDKTMDEDMLEKIQNCLKIRELYLIQRLDRPVGGVMVFAKTKEAAADLSFQVQEKIMQKTYFAVVCGSLDEKKQTITNFLLKDAKTNTSKVVPKGTNGAKEAVLDLEILQTKTLEDGQVLSLVKIDLKTGRHHQIRTQLAFLNIPIWGDTKYNPQFQRKKGWSQIALWATNLTFIHPKEKNKRKYKFLPKEIYPYTEFSYWN